MDRFPTDLGHKIKRKRLKKNWSLTKGWGWLWLFQVSDWKTDRAGMVNQPIWSFALGMVGSASKSFHRFFASSDLIPHLFLHFLMYSRKFTYFLAFSRPIDSVTSTLETIVEVSIKDFNWEYDFNAESLDWDPHLLSDLHRKLFATPWCLALVFFNLSILVILRHFAPYVFLSLSFILTDNGTSSFITGPACPGPTPLLTILHKGSLFAVHAPCFDTNQLGYEMNYEIWKLELDMKGQVKTIWFERNIMRS